MAVALGLVDKKTSPVEFKQLEFPIPRYHPGDVRPEGDLVVYARFGEDLEQLYSKVGGVSYR